MRRTKKLSDSFIKAAGPGTYGDGRGGHGLQLRVHACKSGHVTRTFRQKTRIFRQQTWLGIGPYPAVTLAEARALAMENRVAVLRGQDPRKRGQENTVIVQPATSAAHTTPPPPPPPAMSFEDAAEATIKLHRGGWSSASTEANWRRSLTLPFARKPVNLVTADDIQQAVETFWHKTPRAMNDRLNRIGAVLRWAARHGATDSTPDVRAALPRHRKAVQHHNSVTVTEAPRAFRKLARCTKSRALTRLAIQFAALNASRRSEVTEATWAEIQGDIWTIPGTRMKARREHKVPLSAASLRVLAQARKITGAKGLIFPSTTGKALQGSALAKCLTVCGVKGASVHGFRSTFRNWCAETAAAREVAEACLAHAVKGVEGHYLTTDMLDRRRGLMEAWARYILG